MDKKNNGGALMIKNININNFKSLKNAQIELGHFNLLCGTNASGKSSLLQAILLVAQNFTQDDEIVLNGELVNLGEFREIKNFNASIDVPVSISLADYSQNLSSLSFNQEGVIEKNVNFPRINQQLYYLSANRIGSSDVFERASKKNTFGLLGEFAISFLQDKRDENMPEQLIYDRDNGTAHLFVDEVNYWMEKITGSTLKVEKIQKTNKLVLSYSNNGNYQVRTSNTGSGLSYVVSIIILGLGVGLLSTEDTEKPIVIIENPEIHLHPKAQSLLTEFLSWLSNYMQIILETHSDHIFNGFRKMIKSKRIRIENSNIFFFNLENNITQIKRIGVSQTGKLLTMEKDLFDQFQIDLSELLRK